MLIEDVRLERARLPAAERDGIERAVGDAPERAHQLPDWIERERQAEVGNADAAQRLEEDGDRLERHRAPRDVVGAAERDDTLQRTCELGRRTVRDQPAERVADDERRALAG